MNESEQAQAIAEIKERHEQCGTELDESDAYYCLSDRKELLEIVDSQAQKIAEQAMQIEKLAGLNHVAEAQIERQAMQIAKQAKELAEARAIADAHRDTVMMYKFGNQPQRDDFPDESRIRNPWEKQ